MTITQIDLDHPKQVKQFIELPFRIYEKNACWVPPVSDDIRNMLSPKKHPFYRHSEAAFFLAFDSQGCPAGRLAILNNRNYNEFNRTRTGFFYLYECIDQPELSLQLFNAGFEWARQQKLESVYGPRGFTALDGFGMLVRGFDHRPAFGQLYNPPYYPAQLEAAGFIADHDVVSGYLQKAGYVLPEKVLKVAELVQKRRGLHVERYRTRKDLIQAIPKLHRLFNRILGEGTGGVPLTDQEIRAMAQQMLWFADPQLIKVIAKGDEPVGFLFAYPDITRALQRSKGKVFPFGWLQMLVELRRTDWININGAGMLEEYRGLGGTALLFAELFKTVQESRYRHADLVQIGMENDNMQRELRSLGVDFYKCHRTYRKQLHAET